MMNLSERISKLTADDFRHAETMQSLLLITMNERANALQELVDVRRELADTKKELTKVSLLLKSVIDESDDYEMCDCDECRAYYQ